MTRLFLALGLVVAAFSVASGHPADEKPAPSDVVRTLDPAAQKAIKEAEASIACVLVTRSDIYKKKFDSLLPADNPGGLGGFPWKKQPGIADGQDANEKYDLSQPAAIPETYGGGVVIPGKERLVLTLYHVVRDATKVYVRLPGGNGSYADIHAADPRSDLAVLRLLDPSVGPLKSISIGNGDQIEIGSRILALSYPYAPGWRDAKPRACQGIVKRLHVQAAPGPGEDDPRPDQRLPKPLFMFGMLWQVNLPLNPGCSGHALLNSEGKLVGLTTGRAEEDRKDAILQQFRPPRMPEPPPPTRTFTDRAAGLAVPMTAEITRIITEKLQQGLEVEYGFVGIRTQEPGAGRVQISPNAGMGIVSGSPAAEAGLEAGDYILSINGHKIARADDVQFYVATALAGTPVRFEILREQEVPPKIIKIITLAKSWTPGKIIAANRPAPVRGLRVDYTSVLESQNPQGGFFRRSRGGVQAGVYVSEIQPGSKAAAKLRVRDIITEINVSGKKKAVKTPAEFYAAAAKIRADEALELKLHAHNFDGDSTVVIEP